MITKTKKVANIKLIITMLMIMSMISVFSGCKSKNDNSLELSADNISDYFKNNIVFKDNLQKIDDVVLLKNLYSQIDMNYISEYSVYVSASGATAEEIAVFKLKDDIYSDDITQIIKDRVNSQISNFEDYVPEEVYKLNNSTINQEKNIVVYISCDTPDDVEILFKKLYTK